MGKYLSVIFVLASLCWGQGEWVVQDNPFNGDGSMVFSDVQAVDSLHTWVVGYSTGGGLWVLRTSDGGKNWEAKGPFFNNRAHLSPMRLNYMCGPAIKFLETIHGYFVWGSDVYYTNNGGDSWEKVATVKNNINQLSDVEFVDTLSGWTADNIFSDVPRCIYHTQDGGKTWVIQDSTVVAGVGFLGICFIDTLKGFVVGKSGILLRTTDGGKHWIKVETGTTKDLMDVQFADSLHGIAVGLEGSYTTLRTSDGGNIWTSINGGDGNDIAYPDIKHAWTSSAFFSQDSGLTWTAQELPNVYYIQRNGVSFPDTAHGWIVGDYGRIFHYTTSTGIAEAGTRSLVDVDMQVFPNPAHKLVKITCFANDPEKALLMVYNASGVLVRNLAVGPTSQSVWWDGSDEQGKSVPFGIYFVRLIAAGKTACCKKIVLLN